MLLVVVLNVGAAFVVAGGASDVTGVAGFGSSSLRARLTKSR